MENDLQNHSLSPPMPCALCRSTASEPVRHHDRHGRPLRSVICRECGLVWTDPRPAPDRVRNFYERDYRLQYKGVRQPKPKHTYRAGKIALERFERLRPILAPGVRVLDVGAGGGEVLYIGRALGYEMFGIEPNEGYATYAATVLSVPVAQATYQSAPVAPGSYDVVTLFHTLEHLEDPVDVMQRARRWLVPDGYLVVEVPNIEAKCHQPHQQFHRGHLYHFNTATLELTGRSAGFEVHWSDVSGDRGNIWTVFQNAGSTPSRRAGIAGNYARVRAILDRHTGVRHAFSRYPYVRPFRKLAARLEEWRRVQARAHPKAILDRLVADRALLHGGRAPWLKQAL
jgi:SAM-dependent methyltransferase